MQAKVLHIKHPSKSLLDFVRDLRAKKEAEKAELLANKDKYFPKK